MSAEGSSLFAMHMELRCGCAVEAWKVLTLLAFAVLDGKPLICPHHHCVIETDVMLREASLEFLDYMTSDEGIEKYPFFLRPVLFF